MDGDGSAHGRVNLIGEHTDYNAGLVLPALLPQRTVVAVRTRTDRVISLRSDAPGAGHIELPLDGRTPRHDWSDHLVGVVDALVRHEHELRGFDALVRSDVPIGAGLASSAALAVATAKALREAFGLAIDDRAIAAAAHESEVRFVGAHVGTMDQLVCSLGREGDALLIDTRDGSTRHVPLDELDADIAIIDSGIRHEHARGDYQKGRFSGPSSTGRAEPGSYNRRRAECEAAARELGVATLRDLTEVPTGATVAARRARHVVGENARVGAAVEAIERGDAAAFGRLLNASHASLRDDFEVSVPAIDRIVEVAQRDRDVYGARITGGGFGGSVLLVTRSGASRDAAERVVAASSGAVIVA